MTQSDRNAILKYILLGTIGVTSGIVFHSVAAGILVGSLTMLGLIVGAELA